MDGQFESGLRPTRCPGFSLLELLVVVAVIAILVAIGLPAYRHAIGAGKRAKCAVNLKSIGQALQSYMTDQDGYLPDALGRPSAERENDDDRGRFMTPQWPIYLLLAEVFNGDAPGPRERARLRTESAWPGEKYPTHPVFRCPADRILATGQQSGAFETYFAREGTSYEWNRSLSGRRIGSNVSGTSLLWDFEPFHKGKRNRLQADLSVSISVE